MWLLLLTWPIGRKLSSLRCYFSLLSGHSMARLSGASTRIPGYAYNVPVIIVLYHLVVLLAHQQQVRVPHGARRCSSSWRCRGRKRTDFCSARIDQSTRSCSTVSRIYFRPFKLTVPDATSWPALRPPDRHPNNKSAPCTCAAAMCVATASMV